MSFQGLENSVLVEAAAFLMMLVETETFPAVLVGAAAFLMMLVALLLLLLPATAPSLPAAVRR